MTRDEVAKLKLGDPLDWTLQTGIERVAFLGLNLLYRLVMVEGDHSNELVNAANLRRIDDYRAGMPVQIVDKDLPTGSRAVDDLKVGDHAVLADPPIDPRVSQPHLIVKSSGGFLSCHRLGCIRLLDEGEAVTTAEPCRCDVWITGCRCGAMERERLAKLAHPQS